MKAFDGRFHRTELMLGKEAVGRLRGCFVVVAGLGAVGSYAVEALARSGIGRLRLVDFDTVQPANINRQLYALHSTVGLLKCGEAVKRVLDINPECVAEGVNIRIDAGNAQSALAEWPDLLVDAIDTVSSKAQLLACAVKLKIPSISSMGAALRTDPKLIKTGSIKEAHNCPLARSLRKMLKKDDIEAEMLCVYSSEKTAEIRRAIRLNENFMPQTAEKSGRRPLGSLPAVTGIFGLMLAHEAVKMLLNGSNTRTQMTQMHMMNADNYKVFKLKNHVES